MGDKCVVCGEADQGKPLYKKLGSGEYNVEVIVALRDLELTSLPESAKADHYICWDCDETILQEYGRYLEYEEKRKVQEEKNKEEKRMRKNEQQRKRRLLIAEKSTKPKQPVKTVPEDIYIPKLKQVEVQKTNDHHKSTHCVICDCTFEVANRGYYRHTLKKMVNDDMDVASVMEFLGLARRIAPEVKAKRFVCNKCFYTIRRNYKNKVAKGTSIESPSDGKASKKKKPIHRATPDEHAAEIAKLLPPALAECYKIMTSDTVCSASVGTDVRGNVDANNRTEVNRVDAEVEEEEGLRISQDEHGNFVVDMKIESPSKDSNKMSISSSEQGSKVMESQSLRKKKNVMLPKRHHRHLMENDGEKSSQAESTVPGEISLKVSADGTKNENVDPGEDMNSRTCNICGRTFTGKPDTWWHTLSSSLAGLESVTVSMALQMLETSLANTSEKARLACQVCSLCFGMVSSGFRRQVVERIARQKNIDASQVNFSKIKVRMMRKEDLCGVDAQNIRKNGLDKDTHKTASSNDSNTSKLLLKGKNDSHHATEQKKQKVNNIGAEKVRDHIPGPRSSTKKKHGKYSKIKTDNKYGKTFDSNSSDDNFFYGSNYLSYKSGLGAAERVTPKQCVSSESNIDGKRKKPVVNHKSPSGAHAIRTKGNFNHPQSEKKQNLLTSSESKTGMVSSGKEIPAICSVKEVLVVNSGISHCGGVHGDSTDAVLPVNEKKYYEVNRNCQFYFPLSKMQEAKVVLRDMRRSLPKEAFDGRTLLAHNQPNGGYQISYSNSSPPSSAFQFLLNAVLPPNWSNCAKKVQEIKAKKDNEGIVSGRCVVCAYFFHRPLSMWHNLREDIKPPSLQVPVRWVLASLSIAPVRLTAKEKEEGKVCEGCFSNLTKQFEEFVRVKIGESCDMIPSQVVITDYVVTFNQETMNIEADPVDLTPEEEVEESSRIVSKVDYMLKCVNFDNLLDGSYINPLSKEDFTTCLLLALNEFRVQIGVSSAKLMDWLMQLMPMEYHMKGLQPLESKVLMFINSITATLDGSSRDFFEKLSTTLPVYLFTPHKSLKALKRATECPEIKKEIKEEDQEVQTDQSEREIKWEDFLNRVNIDHLLEGKGRPLPRKYFNNGLLYGLWRLAADLKVGEDVLGNWLQQVSPIPLEKEHVELLLNAPKPIHDHLLQHPEDIRKLDCVIIPEPPASSSNKGKGVSKLSGVKESSKTVHPDPEVIPAGENGRLISHQASVISDRGVANKRKAEWSIQEKNYNKRLRGVIDSSPSSSTAASMSSPSPSKRTSSKEVDTSMTVSTAKLKPDFQTPGNRKSNSQISDSPPKFDTSISESPTSKSQQGSVTKAGSGISQKLTLTKRKLKKKCKVRHFTAEESQESNNNESHNIKECQEPVQTQEIIQNEVEGSAVESGSGELASKIKELEEQLQAVKRQNQELLELNEKLGLSASKGKQKEIQVKENEQIPPCKNSTLKSTSQSKVQMELKDVKPGQAISSPGNTAKRQRKLSLKRGSLSLVKEGSEEARSPVLDADKNDQTSLMKVDKLKLHNEGIVQKHLVQSEFSQPPVISSGVTLPVGIDDKICGNPESPAPEETGIANAIAGEKCLKKDGKSEEIWANIRGKEDEVDFEKPEENENVKDMEEKVETECEGSGKKQLSIKDREDCVDSASGRDGSDAAQSSLLESAKIEQVPSPSTVTSDSSDISHSKLALEDELLDSRSESVASEISKESDLSKNITLQNEPEGNAPSSDMVTEGDTDISNTEGRSESPGNSKTLEGCAELENEAPTLQESSGGMLDSVMDCDDERQSHHAVSDHSCLEKPSLEDDSSNQYSDKGEGSSSVTKRSDVQDPNDLHVDEPESPNTLPEIEEQDADSTFASPLEDKDQVEGKKLSENQKGNDKIEDIAEEEERRVSIEKRDNNEDIVGKEERNASIEKIHKDKTPDLEKKQISVVESGENEQTHIESEVTCFEKGRKSDTEEEKTETRKDVSDNSACLLNEKSLSDSILKESDRSDSSVTNGKKGNCLAVDGNKEIVGNVGCTEMNKKSTEFPTRIGVDGEVSSSKSEIRDKVSGTQSKKIKVKRNSLVGQFTAVNKHNILSANKRKDSECKTTGTDNNGKKRRVDILPQSSSTGIPPEKVAASKKAKPRFEDLMTYDI
ncbi:uncharacterized protein [Macrobrachium rosenbergii]|uniref:uncharacterized protein n=1 Tax=Macrobrachium rosenbergii TaxID=79674 RepID=UPI0034D750CB